MGIVINNSSIVEVKNKDIESVLHSDVLFFFLGAAWGSQVRSTVCFLLGQCVLILKGGVCVRGCERKRFEEPVSDFPPGCRGKAVKIKPGDQ